MSEQIAKKTITFKNKGSVSIEGLHNKRFIFSLVYIHFDTNEKDLLNGLLQKFIHEKVLIDGVNINNGIVSASATENGIVFMLPEAKIISVITQIFTYLNKATLNSRQKKYMKSGDYDSLEKDIREFEILITGKCKNFSRALLNSDDKKLQKLTENLNNVESKKREKFTTDDPIVLKNIPFNTSSQEDIMDIIVFLKDSSFIISGNEIIPMTCDTNGKIANKLVYTDTINGQLKSWKNQCGSIGKPASNDKDATKWKSKSDNILKSMNFITKIYSSLHSFKFTYQLTQLKEVNKTSGSAIKNIKIP